MLSSFVVEISGRQYNISPGITLRVGYLGDIKSFECEKVLSKIEDGHIFLGNPYLKEKLVFDVLGKTRKKIRVFTYKAKANTRKIKGVVHITSMIKLQSKVEKKEA